MKSTPRPIKNRMSFSAIVGSKVGPPKFASVETIVPMSSYVSAWRIASMWLTARHTFTVSPPPSAYPMTTSPPVPVSHSWLLKHSMALSIVAWSRSCSARAIDARMNS